MSKIAIREHRPNGRFLPFVDNLGLKSELPSIILGAMYSNPLPCGAQRITPIHIDLIGLPRNGIIYERRLKGRNSYHMKNYLRNIGEGIDITNCSVILCDSRAEYEFTWHKSYYQFTDIGMYQIPIALSLSTTTSMID